MVQVGQTVLDRYIEEFMTSWSIYQGINKYTRTMHNPMQQTMLFFGYL